MATGIVAVAARDNGQPLVRRVFAAAAACGLALIVVWSVVARIPRLWNSVVARPTGSVAISEAVELVDDWPASLGR